MEQQPTIEGLQEQLKVVTEDCYQAEMSLHKLERNTEDVQSIFQKIQQLFNEMRETWQEGEMSAPKSQTYNKKRCISNRGISMKAKRITRSYKRKNMLLWLKKMNSIIKN